MNLKYKIQDYQTAAVKAVIDCFNGQERGVKSPYMMDQEDQQNPLCYQENVYRNSHYAIDQKRLINNIRSVQERQHLILSETLQDFKTIDGNGTLKKSLPSYDPGAEINLDIEMETGTGKTYCYIKTMFEMHKKYGWSKFIVIVPSIAVREGVVSAFKSMSQHFMEDYGHIPHCFIFNKETLHDVHSFSSNPDLNVMIINIQTFNTRSTKRLIYEKSDQFRSRSPMEVLSANRPILIMDEPQKMGSSTLKSLPEFNPLMALRYSATHRHQHCLIHRLDALDAINQKLVKKISVMGISILDDDHIASPYLFVEGIDTSSTHPPTARIEIEVKLRSGKIKRQIRRLKSGSDTHADLYCISNELSQYRGYIIESIDARKDVVEFKNGERIKVGEATGDVTEKDIRRWQIRQTIITHMDKESQVFAQGVKVLSLFFIDEVKKYRDYERSDKKGEYARIFEDEYKTQIEQYLSDATRGSESYRNYLIEIDASKTHNGYFSVDKKGRMTNPNTIRRGSEKGYSKDQSAYDLILKNKEALLTIDEPTRFIFSHSALREGWDNPNVFAICMLKRSASDISRRQEVGRGLRISVNQHGERTDCPSTVHEVNTLSIIVSESYDDFANGLQSEIADTLYNRPLKASEEYFLGKSIQTPSGVIKINETMATQISHYLIKHDFIDDRKYITPHYRKNRSEDTLPNMGGEIEKYRLEIIKIIDNLIDGIPLSDNGRKRKNNCLNENFSKKEFQELWNRINKQAIFKVAIDPDEIIEKCVTKLNEKLKKIKPLQLIIEKGELNDNLTEQRIREKGGFATPQRSPIINFAPAQSHVKYDLIGQVAKNSHITRKTCATILSRLDGEAFEGFTNNPERFISESSGIIQERIGAMTIRGLVYDETDKCYSTDIFTSNVVGQDFSNATEKLRKHIYDFAITDSNVEREFASALDASSEVTVYAKLPRSFLIPTPVGNYNPDWAISFREGSQRFLYFVIETKGSLKSLQLRPIEDIKIECAKKFFSQVSQCPNNDQVTFDVVTDFNGLLHLVKAVVSPNGLPSK
ncbi:MAG: DEAD/DEAH box helicase family protein [Bacteroidetes bacterium]|nr:DEAD/DEAH box helicase family protein [Bacteroidota bacterium]